MTIVYKPFDQEALEIYRCRLSGRKEFDGFEGSYKSRWLVAQGHAEWAMVFDGEQPYSRWEWNKISREANKVFGPDL